MMTPGWVLFWGLPASWKTRIARNPRMTAMMQPEAAKVQIEIGLWTGSVEERLRSNFRTSPASVELGFWTGSVEASCRAGSGAAGAGGGADAGGRRRGTGSNRAPGSSRTHTGWSSAGCTGCSGAIGVSMIALKLAPQCGQTAAEPQISSETGCPRRHFGQINEIDDSRREAIARGDPRFKQPIHTRRRAWPRHGQRR
jgi:hypothetical protein